MPSPSDDQEPNGWPLVSEAVRSGAQPRAVTNVIRTLAVNRGYIGALGEEQLATMIINQLLYDGWTLTPPEETDDDPDPRRDRRGDGQAPTGPS